MAHPQTRVRPLRVTPPTDYDSDGRPRVLDSAANRYLHARRVIAFCDQLVAGRIRALRPGYLQLTDSK